MLERTILSSLPNREIVLTKENITLEQIQATIQKLEVQSKALFDNIQFASIDTTSPSFSNNIELQLETLENLKSQIIKLHSTNVSETTVNKSKSELLSQALSSVDQLTKLYEKFNFLADIGLKSQRKAQEIPSFNRLTVHTNSFELRKYNKKKQELQWRQSEDGKLDQGNNFVVVDGISNTRPQELVSDIAKYVVNYFTDSVPNFISQSSTSSKNQNIIVSEINRLLRDYSDNLQKERNHIDADTPKCTLVAYKVVACENDSYGLLYTSVGDSPLYIFDTETKTLKLVNKLHTGSQAHVVTSYIPNIKEHDTDIYPLGNKDTLSNKIIIGASDGLERFVYNIYNSSFQDYLEQIYNEYKEHDKDINANFGYYVKHSILNTISAKRDQNKLVIIPDDLTFIMSSVCPKV
jgi:serine/threonine protein phosphatase PrpC